MAALAQNEENRIAPKNAAMRSAIATEERAAQIVREEWHRAVAEFGLKPGSPAEAMAARMLDRIYAITRSRED